MCVRKTIGVKEILMNVKDRPVTPERGIGEERERSKAGRAGPRNSTEEQPGGGGGPLPSL